MGRHKTRFTYTVALQMTQPTHAEAITYVERLKGQSFTVSQILTDALVSAARAKRTPEHYAQDGADAQTRYLAHNLQLAVDASMAEWYAKQEALLRDFGQTLLDELLARGYMSPEQHAQASAPQADERGGVVGGMVNSLLSGYMASGRLGGS